MSAQKKNPCSIESSFRTSINNFHIASCEKLNRSKKKGHLASKKKKKKKKKMYEP